MLFVTDDKAFYEGREHSNGLAAALREESSCNRSFTLFARLADLLNELRSHVAIDHDALTAALLAKEFGSLEGLLQRNGFQLAERTKLEAELFLTEKPHTCSWNSRSDSDASTLAGAIAAMGSSLSEATASTTLRPASFLTWES